MTKFSWTNISDTAYIYFEGKGASQTQAVRYLGGASMLASTGEKVLISSHPIETIPRQRLWIYPQGAEVDRHAWMGWFARMDHWFSGISVDSVPHEEAKEYQTLYPQDESGSFRHFSTVDANASLAQETDIRCHHDKYNALMKQHPEIDNVVLYAASRGAASSFRAMARHKEVYDKVKLCVLEAPPASILDLFKFYFKKSLGKWLYNDFIAHLFLGHQHQADPKEQAIEDVKDFPDHVPLLIISSKNDKIVPHSSPFKLASAVAAKRQKQLQAGKEVAPVYFLQLDAPDHNGYWSEKYATDAKRYEAVVHAVYKQHDLPYGALEAMNGKDELELINLVTGPLAQQVQFQALFKEHKNQREELSAQAHEELKATLHTLPHKERERAVEICSYMKMYKNQSFWNSEALKASSEDPDAVLVL